MPQPHGNSRGVPKKRLSDLFFIPSVTLDVNQNIILFNIVGQGEGRSPGIGIGKTGSIIHLF